MTKSSDMTHDSGSGRWKMSTCVYVESILSIQAVKKTRGKKHIQLHESEDGLEWERRGETAASPPENDRAETDPGRRVTDSGNNEEDQMLTEL